MDISEDKICSVCSYYKTHSNEFITPLNHFTCLCEFFKKKYICCKKGYTNLITKIPHIVIYSPIPEVINSCYIHNSPNFIPSNKSILEILNFAFNQKIEVLHSQSFLFGNHPYIKYG